MIIMEKKLKKNLNNYKFFFSNFSTFQNININFDYI